MGSVAFLWNPARHADDRHSDGRRAPLTTFDIACSDTLRDAVDRLGRVDWIFAPNRFHHLCANQWAVAYPDAPVAGPRGLHQKRRDLPISMFADEDAPDAIDPEIQMIGIGGWPVLGRYVRRWGN